MRRDNKQTFFMQSLLLVLALVCLVPAAYAQPAVQDVVTVGSVTSTSHTIDVPVYIRDVSGTPLGLDQPSGSRIQSYSLTVNYAPTAAVQSVTFTRAGITLPLTPTQEFTPSSAGSVSLIDTFTESTDLIPFTLNGAAPGNQVGHLVFTLSPSVTTATQITLTLDPTLTQLTDQGGDAATKESVTGGNLALVNGTINFVLSLPAMSPLLLLVLAASLALVGMRLRS